MFEVLVTSRLAVRTTLRRSVLFSPTNGTPGKGKKHEKKQRGGNRRYAQIPAPETLTRNSREHCAQHGAPDRAGDSNAQKSGRQMTGLRQCARRTGDDGRVESQ